jgi:predicted house-cleaning noncanonical NTP pyrophosphatase (MazG superfamily)
MDKNLNEEIEKLIEDNNIEDVDAEFEKLADTIKENLQDKKNKQWSVKTKTPAHITKAKNRAKNKLARKSRKKNRKK